MSSFPVIWTPVLLSFIDLFLRLLVYFFFTRLDTLLLFTGYYTYEVQSPPFLSPPLYFINFFIIVFTGLS